MHKDWSLQCHFLVLKSGPPISPILTVVERGRFQTSIMIDLVFKKFMEGLLKTDIPSKLTLLKT